MKIRMKMNWFFSAISTMILFTVLYLLYKKVGAMDVKSDVLLFYYYLFAIPLILVLSFSINKQFSLSIPKTAIILMLIAAIAGVLGNFFIVQSIKTAPNPGYSLAISSANILLVAIFSIFLFKSDFTAIKWIGMILTLIGIILLGWK